MKIKAVTRKDVPQEFLDYLNSEQIAGRIFMGVLVRHLHVDEKAGAAEHYLQETDFAITLTRNKTAHFCEVRLTGVSVNDYRSLQDFRNALDALTDIYISAIVTYLRAPKNQKAQLMVSIMADGPIPRTNPPTSLLEKVIEVDRN